MRVTASFILELMDYARVHVKTAEDRDRLIRLIAEYESTVLTDQTMRKIAQTHGKNKIDL